MFTCEFPAASKQVADFGLSRVLEDNMTHMSTNLYGARAAQNANCMLRSVYLCSKAPIRLPLFTPMERPTSVALQGRGCFQPPTTLQRRSRTEEQCMPR